MRAAPAAGRFYRVERAKVMRAWRALVEMVGARRERPRAREQLTAMTERELQDCGITRAGIAYELQSPGDDNKGMRRAAFPVLQSRRNLFGSAGVSLASGGNRAPDTARVWEFHADWGFERRDAGEPRLPWTA